MGTTHSIARPYTSRDDGVVACDVPEHAAMPTSTDLRPHLRTFGAYMAPARAPVYATVTAALAAYEAADVTVPDPDIEALCITLNDQVRRPRPSTSRAVGLCTRSERSACRAACVQQLLAQNRPVVVVLAVTDDTVDDGVWRRSGDSVGTVCGVAAAYNSYTRRMHVVETAVSSSGTLDVPFDAFQTALVDAFCVTCSGWGSEPLFVP